VSARLWNFFDGEPYLDNPQLVILNPKKKASRRKNKRTVVRTVTKEKTTMRTNARRRRRTRRSYRRRSNPVAAVNPRRRRRSYRARSHRRRHRANPVINARRRRRSYRRNPPDILGFPVKDIAMAGVAVIAAPFIERQVIGLLPTSLAGSKSGRWIVKVGSAALIGFGAKKLLGGHAGNLALVALGANLVADAVQEFAPQLTGYSYAPALGNYPTSYLPPADHRPLFPFPNPKPEVFRPPF
jgi:hypothetical protein